jgi:cytochrome c-type biogenesis protein CcmH/NrfG
MILGPPFISRKTTARRREGSSDNCKAFAEIWNFGRLTALLHLAVVYPADLGAFRAVETWHITQPKSPGFGGSRITSNKFQRAL